MADNASVNVSQNVVGDLADEGLVLQPLWNFVLANSHYTASPLFPIFLSNSTFFLCMIPFIILDFYGLDHWAWVKRYKIEPDVRVTWQQVGACATLIAWNQILFVLPITIAQYVWTPDVRLPQRAPDLVDFLWQTPASLAVFDAGFFIWHYIHHRIGFLYKHVHSVHHRYSRANVWVSQYDHPWELISLGILGTVSPWLLNAHPLTGWAFMLLNDWVGAESHAGYDLPGMPQHWAPFWGGPIKHYMHHKRPLTNFQPYFNWIDRLVGTECPGIRAGGHRPKELLDWEKKHSKKYDAEW